MAKRAFKRLMAIKRSGANIDRANFERKIQYNMVPYDRSDSDEFFSAERYEDDSDSSSESAGSSVEDDDDSFEFKRKRNFKRGGYRLWKHQSASNNLKKKH